MTEEQSPYCRLCGVLVDDDPDEFMVEGLCLTCNTAYQEGKKAADNALRKALERMCNVVRVADVIPELDDVDADVYIDARAALAGEKA